MNTVYIEHMGCPGRILDARKCDMYFRANGFRVIRHPRKAEHILFISCAYKENIQLLAQQRIKKLAGYKGRLIVGGCLSTINPSALTCVFQGPTITTQRLEDIDKFFPGMSVPFKSIGDANILFPDNISQKLKRILSFSINTRLLLTFSASFFKRLTVYVREKNPIVRPWYIRISRGCIDTHCSYCTIWKAVGALQSKPLHTCMTEFNTARAKGYSNIILVGENTGAYGTDTGSSLTELLTAMTSAEGSFHVKIDCIHPMWLIRYCEELSQILKRGKIRTILSPIQSGNNRILKLMNRQYTVEEVTRVLLQFKKQYPFLRFHTHIIVGFPSETDKEFDETLTVVQTIGFYSVQIYPYGHNSVISPDIDRCQIDPSVIKERIRRAAKCFRARGIGYMAD